MSWRHADDGDLQRQERLDRTREEVLRRIEETRRREQADRDEEKRRKEKEKDSRQP